MENYTERMATYCREFLLNLEKELAGNKSAGQRARKASLQISNNGVGYRKESTARSTSK